MKYVVKRYFSNLVGLMLFSLTSCTTHKKDKLFEEPTFTEQGSTIQTDTIKYDKYSSDTSKAISISAVSLTRAFLDNEVSAENKYKSKKLLVSGVTEDIKRGYASGNVFISLKGSERVTSVQCFLIDEKVAEGLKKGQEIEIEGFCEGLNVNVILNNCKLKATKDK